MTSNTNNYITKSQKLQLIESLKSIPADLALVPVIGKAPKRVKWQSEAPINRQIIIDAINNGKATGYGVRLGIVSAGIVAVDIDGTASHAKYAEIFGKLPDSDPTTIKTTSGKPGRQCEFYYIHEMYWQDLHTVKIKTGVKGADGKEELLEIRWDGLQQVLPPSVHPETGSYSFLPRCGFTDGVNIAEAPITLIEKMIKDDRENLTPIPVSYENNYDGVSLENLINKDCRILLNSGSSLGSLNNDSILLAQELIGAENQARDLGFILSDSARQLFDLFCSRCTPPPKQKLSEIRWNWVQKSNPGASLPVDVMTNCYTAAQKKNNLTKDELAVKRENKVNHPKNKVVNNDKVLPLPDTNILTPEGEQNLRDDIDKLINEDLPNSELKARLAKIRRRYQLTEKETNDIYSHRAKELEPKTFEKSEFDNYFDSTQKHLGGIKYFLPGKLQNISTICTNLGLTPEAGIMMLYSAVCSLLHPDTELEVFKETMFVVNPTIYCAIIGESGIKKSPLQRILILNPLRELDKIEQARYEQKKLEYDSIQDEKQKAEMGEPVKRTLFIGGGTSEGIRELCKVNKGRGILRLNDELSSLFDSQGKYSNGKGDDQQQILSAYDGYLPTVARVGQKGYVAGTSDRVNLPIIGAIQPTVLKKIFVKRDVDDPAGEFARFMLCQQPCKPAHIGDATQIKIDLNDYLAGFYKQVDSIGVAKFSLSPGARTLFEKLYDRCEDLKVSDLAEAIKHQYQKLPGKVAKIALIIHIVTAIETTDSSQEIPLEISEQTMKAAITWGNYQSAQVISFYEELDPKSINPLLTTILNKTGPTGLRIADLKSGIRELRTKTKEEIIEILQTLVKYNRGYLKTVNGAIRFFKQDDCQDDSLELTEPLTISDNF